MNIEWFYTGISFRIYEKGTTFWIDDYTTFKSSSVTIRDNSTLVHSKLKPYSKINAIKSAKSYEYTTLEINDNVALVYTFSQGSGKHSRLLQHSLCYSQLNLTPIRQPILHIKLSFNIDLGFDHAMEMASCLILNIWGNIELWFMKWTQFSTHQELKGYVPSTEAIQLNGSISYLSNVWDLHI